MSGSPLVVFALLALSLASLTSAASLLSSNCLYTDDDGAVFDLSPLGAREYSAENPSDVYYMFLLNPCLPLTSLPTNSICPAGTFVCQVSRSTLQPSYLVGKTHTGLDQVDPTTFTALISGGEYCPGNGMFRAAVITFTCGPDEGSPQYKSEASCTFHFTWATKYACEPASPPLTTYEKLLEALAEGRNVKVVYDFNFCSNKIDGKGGASIQRFSSYDPGKAAGVAYIEYSESRVGQHRGKFFNIVEDHKIFATNEVVIFTSYLDLVNGLVAGNTTVTCPYGEGASGAQFYID